MGIVNHSLTIWTEVQTKFSSFNFSETKVLLLKPLTGQIQFTSFDSVPNTAHRQSLLIFSKDCNFMGKTVR